MSSSTTRSTHSRTYLGEFALTNLTLVGFDSRVNAGVLREIRRVGEALGAGGTLVGLGILLVDLLAVDQHVRLRVENLKHTYTHTHIYIYIHTHTHTVGTLPQHRYSMSDLVLKI